MDKEKQSEDGVEEEKTEEFVAPPLNDEMTISIKSMKSGTKDLAENLSLLQNLDKFKLDHDDLIDISIPRHPGITNAGVTKQASLYIASLNLLQIFDLMDDNCDVGNFQSAFILTSLQ
tara:strand:- start:242 stop:595 length:354 start_codon:yes stop_codon:yes gene_type:complete